MIPAPPGLSARYKHDNPKHWTHRRVVAFDDDLKPLVSDDHRLEYADRYSNYDGITDHHDPGDGAYTALMPAAGWRIEYTDPDGSKWSEPLVGWAIKDGGVVALAADSTGLVDDLDHYSGEFRVRIPPHVHRALAMEAAEQGISLNRLASAKLTG